MWLNKTLQSISGKINVFNNPIKDTHREKHPQMKL